MRTSPGLFRSVLEILLTIHQRKRFEVYVWSIIKSEEIKRLRQGGCLGGNEKGELVVWLPLEFVVLVYCFGACACA